MTLVAEESAKSKAAKEVIKSLTAQVHLALLSSIILVSFKMNMIPFFSPEIIDICVFYVAQGHG